jgi:hypothetical protein
MTDPTTEPTTCQAGIGVLFLDRGWNSNPRRPPDHRARGIATGADNRGRRFILEEPSDFAKQTSGNERPTKVAPPAAAINRLSR